MHVGACRKSHSYLGIYELAYIRVHLKGRNKDDVFTGTEMPIIAETAAYSVFHTCTKLHYMCVSLKSKKHRQNRS